MRWVWLPGAVYQHFSSGFFFNSMTIEFWSEMLQQLRVRRSRAFDLTYMLEIGRRASEANFGINGRFPIDYIF